MKNKNNWDNFVLTGCNADPQDRDGVWKVVSSNPIPPIENIIKQILAYGMYESLVGGSFTTYNGRAYLSVQVTHSNPNTQTQSTYTLFSVFKDEDKPQFTCTPFNIPLNAVMFAQKVIGYPICWNGAIPIDCYIDVDGHVRINTMSTTGITWHKTRADLNKQLGRQGQKNMVFLLCLLSLTKQVIDLASSLVYRQISVLDPMSSKIINVESNQELINIAESRQHLLVLK
ncbi:MAG: hypothetical protein EZS28_035949 [Streblomastix strix]|uniref:Uncharacterized protein n=1 Tax=Streblomastix strix TaxID=222440 RepID=A0A5J4UE80_9EUKA|nr:MAG: hypothetical protein EZS28_035949 [Streblomastix strix]